MWTRGLLFFVGTASLIVIGLALPLASWLGSMAMWLGAGLVTALAGLAFGPMMRRRGADTPDQPPRGLTIVVAGLLLAAGVVVAGRVPIEAWITRQFGPPTAVMREQYAPNADGAAFDHAEFDALLRAHVDASGWVDYEALRTNAARLDDYLARLAVADLDVLTRDAKLALLINAYNACTLRLILDHWPVDSIRDIPADERWAAARWTVAGRTVSLNELEHEWIRTHFAEPRIHFALVCAAAGCPPLRAEAWTGATLDPQFADQMARTHSNPRWCEVVDGGPRVRLTRLYQWYAGDFEQAAGSVEAYVAPHLPVPVDPTMMEIEWLPYDWRLNALTHPAAAGD